MKLFKKMTGFSLLEVMVTLGILSILTAIAIPSYTYYTQKARRSEGMIAVMDLSQRMERYYAENHTYVGATIANTGPVSPTENGYYTLVITATTATTFNIRANPASIQTGDTECASYTQNELGQKGITGTGTVGDCW